MVTYNNNYFEEIKYDSIIKGINTSPKAQMLLKYTVTTKVSMNLSHKLQKLQFHKFYGLELIETCAGMEHNFCSKRNTSNSNFLFLAASSLALQSMLCTVAQEHLHG